MRIVTEILVRNMSTPERAKQKKDRNTKTDAAWLSFYKARAPVQLVLPKLPLHKAERERLIDGVGKLFRIPRVHADRSAQRLRTPREFTQDKHAWPIIIVDVYSRAQA